MNTITVQASQKRNTLLLLLIGVGLIACGVGVVFSPARSWVMMLTANFYFFCLGLFGTFLLCISYVVKASCFVPYRRVLEAMAGTVPVLGLFLLTISFGAETLYEWTDPSKIANDEVLQTKLAYLNMPFFIVRNFAAILVMSFVSGYLVLRSKKQDQDKNHALAIEEGLSSFSAVSLVFLAISLTFLTFDWIMSVNPHWYSTIYGVLIFSGLLSYGPAFCLLAIFYLQRRNYLTQEINENHYHDLGKMLFGFSTFWAYIWYSQYLLIWYANIPEEVSYFYNRSKDGWSWIVWSTIVTNWLIPFFLLLSRRAKRNPKVLGLASGIIMMGQFIYLYVMIAPNVFAYNEIPGPHLGLVELSAPLFYVGVFLLTFFKILERSSIIAINSPYLEEGLALEQ